MKQKVNSIWMNGQKVGYWRVLSNGDQELFYEESWLHSPYARALSLSLPLRFDGSVIKGEAVSHYFENLLPENEKIRNYLARHFKVLPNNTFALLSAIGRIVSVPFKF